ncbi:MAG TPA: GTPase HflX [Chloroflexota bacterium]|nr:GTPase HflX [Chloroflexota bacterium]
MQTELSQEAPRAVLLGADTSDGWNIDDSLAELARLADTAGVDVVGDVAQRVREPQPRSYLGKGKITELRQQKGTLHFDTVIADDELTPAQQRYLESTLDVQVLDRTAIILHIFAQHARTREGRLQVELAQYRYRLPRLTGRGVELSRLGAGINTRGPGETKLESDRRRIRHRIAELNRDIEQVRSFRALHRRQRRASGIPVVALVGYTNAGKSTLMNALTGAGVLSSDRLFATLDPTTRRLDLPNHQEILLTDTVGFIQKLPTDLVAAFRATLEEVAEADVILHVIDASHPQLEEQAEAVEDELESLGAENKPRITVLNKADLVPPERIPFLRRRFPSPVVASAVSGTGLDALRAALADRVSGSFVPVKVTIPYTAARYVSLFRERGMVEREDHRAEGTVITGRLPVNLLPSFQPYLA